MGFLEGLIYMIWRGIAIGVIISAPMGPVGILCVQRTLDKGRKNGLFTGVGAAISDIIYCLLTGFGLSFIEDFLKANQDIIQIIGSVVLMVFGLYLFRSNPARTLKTPEEAKVSPKKTIISGFLFTFSNPLIIFLIIGLFARFNFTLPEILFPQYMVGFVAIFAGALLWWWVVTYFVDKVRSHFNLRSMWLINRITGCIIMVFALVGVITGVSGIASAAPAPAPPRSEYYYNSSRGFGEWNHENILVLDNQGCEEISKYIPLCFKGDFSFSFRASNLNNAEGKKYSHICEGKKRKVSHPLWSLQMKDSVGRILRFSFVTIHDRYDNDHAPRIKISAFLNDKLLREVDLTSGFDSFNGANSWKLQYASGCFYLSGGNRHLESVLEINEYFTPSEIGFGVMPGAKLSLDWMSLIYEQSSPSFAANDRLAPFASKDFRDDYFARSKDAVEGEFAIFDISLTDSMLLGGGDYRVAVVKAPDSAYDIIYLSGAKVNGEAWHEAMLKGRLIPTPFKYVYDVEWYDPAGKRLTGPIKAQFLPATSILSITFASHSSQVRFRRIKEPTRSADSSR